ncbi:tRNA-splicing endonuclease subunit Sen54 [Chanos chanos]|uniref:tRNA-splicing endonuclease subunit Sen54 n=1 Tax=Chanos chanos TaxID=29144 RepID=A0A6J2WPJ7_CHACN|nr:tRNA-splicing endonuclease subunit Sen54 [Chanos chanos]
MGFSDRGKQCLLPEEALYLMECGNLQVLYRDLPLSIQEGYELFLTLETVSLQQYQVFSHLKRLGYVLTRFDRSTVPTQYERQLNLTHCRDKQGKHLKRKRSQSPTARYPNSAITPSTHTTPHFHRPRTETPSQGEAMESSSNSGGTPGRSWWIREGDDPQPTGTQNPDPRWDFMTISFPDLGSRRTRCESLASPEPSLLPGALRVGSCDVGAWLGKLNLKQERLSRRERERQRYRDRYKRDVNNDPEVRRCRNWAEYAELLERRRSQRRRERPANLWEGSVTPLTQPGECLSHGELLERISVVEPSHLFDAASRLASSDEWSICFNVYQPDTVAEFKKSDPGRPYTRLCICSFDGPVPELHAIKQLSLQSGDVPVTFAVVDHGDVSFYCFKDFQLPVDVVS